MAERPINDQLDDLVTEILAGERPDLSKADPLVAQLSEVATELRGLPSTFFFQELKERLTRSNEMNRSLFIDCCRSRRIVKECPIRFRRL